MPILGDLEISALGLLPLTGPTLVSLGTADDEAIGDGPPGAAQGFGSGAVKGCPSCVLQAAPAIGNPK